MPEKCVWATQCTKKGKYTVPLAKADRHWLV